MLNNFDKAPLQKSSSSVEQLIPDPWETPSPTVETKSIPDSWQIPIDTHPLILPIEISETRRLSPALNPIKVLLQDELKLKVPAGSQFKTQMEQALGLLCWMGIVNSASV
jgi:hypothetical protein